MEPTRNIGLFVSATPTDVENTEIDISVWLNMRGACFDGKEYRVEDVIRAIADTCGGGHYDPDIDPFAEYLLYSYVGSTGDVMSAMTHLVVPIAVATLNLIERTLQEAINKGAL